MTTKNGPTRNERAGMTQFLLGLAIGILGILVTIVVAIYQQRSPRLSVEFQIPTDGDPAAIDCLVRNEGRGEARDVILSFRNMLPLDTKVFAAPEVGAELVESESPPDPTLGPAAASLLTAFSVRLPRIASKDHVTFQVRTTNDDNKRAAKQALRIRREMSSVVAEFGMRLKSKHPDETNAWNTDAEMLLQTKEACFFRPSRLSYELGRFDVSLYDDREELVRAKHQDLYARFKKEFLDVFENRPKFKAPVIRIKTSEGNRTCGIMPPYVNAWAQVGVPIGELTQSGSVILYPAVPDSYE